MLSMIYRVYAYVFGRVLFAKLNKFLYQISLRGLGILNYQGDYLIGENAWLKKYLQGKKNPIILDVGAHVGNYSKTIFDIDQESKILAFEPHPSTLKKLITNVKSKNFEAFNVGVGSSAGALELYDYDTKDGSQHASLYKDVIKTLHKGNPISHLVEIITLDKLLSDKNIIEIDLLKIDTEGNEYNVLLGVKSFLKKRKIKAIHLEFNEMNIISKSTFKDFWDLLLDYKFYRILPGGELLPIKNYIPLMTEIYAFQNIVAILKD